MMGIDIFYQQYIYIHIILLIFLFSVLLQSISRIRKQGGKIPKNPSKSKKSGEKTAGRITEQTYCIPPHQSNQIEHLQQMATYEVLGR